MSVDAAPPPQVINRPSASNRLPVGTSWGKVSIKPGWFSQWSEPVSLQQPGLGQCNRPGADTAHNAAKAVVALDRGHDCRVGGGHLRVTSADEQPRCLVQRIKPAIDADRNAGRTDDRVAGFGQQAPVVQGVLRQLVGNAQWLDG
jgi:hypothetical protein